MPFGPMPAEEPSGFASAPEALGSPASHAPSMPPVPAAGTSATLRVHPDRVVALKRDLEAVRDRVTGFLRSRGRDLRVPPMAGDPVSKRASEAFTANAELAINVANQFVAELNRNIQSLQQAIENYKLTENANTSTFDRRI